MVRLGVGECERCCLKFVSNEKLNEYSCSLGDKGMVVFRSIGKNKVKWEDRKEDCRMKYMIV